MFHLLLKNKKRFVLHLNSFSFLLRKIRLKFQLLPLHLNPYKLVDHTVKVVMPGEKFPYYPISSYSLLLFQCCLTSKQFSLTHSHVNLYMLNKILAHSKCSVNKTKGAVCLLHSVLQKEHLEQATYHLGWPDH